jgi:hypothetical protein
VDHERHLTVAPTVPAGEPVALAAGTTWTWSQSWADFPPGDGWSVTYYAAGPSSFSVTTTPRTSDYLALKAATDTAILLPGVYFWEARASLSGAVYVAGTGTFAVSASTNVEAESDQRTHAQIMLARVEAELEARILGTGSAHESYGNGDQSITKLSIEALKALRTTYSLEVQRQANGGQLPSYEVSFVRP